MRRRVHLDVQMKLRTTQEVKDWLTQLAGEYDRSVNYIHHHLLLDAMKRAEKETPIGAATPCDGDQAK